jgi:hypothetical protein
MFYKYLYFVTFFDKMKILGYILAFDQILKNDLWSSWVWSEVLEIDLLGNISKKNYMKKIFPSKLML